MNTEKHGLLTAQSRKGVSNYEVKTVLSMMIAGQALD